MCVCVCVYPLSFHVMLERNAWRKFRSNERTTILVPFYINTG